MGCGVYSMTYGIPIFTSNSAEGLHFSAFHYYCNSATAFEHAPTIMGGAAYI